MKVCFAGAGSIGKRHIKNLKGLCRDQKIPCEIDLLRSSDKPVDDDLIPYINKQYFLTDDLNQKYDMIFITNPTYKHYDTIRELKSFSNNFFVEKPLFDNCNIQIDSLKLPEENIYYIACPLRYTSVLMEAKKVVQKEKVYSARAISTSYLPDWRPGIDYRKVYSAHKEEGGGVRIDLIHEWDYLVSLFGIPQDIFSYSGKYSELEINSEDLAVYVAKYKDKLVEVHLDYFGKKVRRDLEIRTKEHEYIFDIQNGLTFQDGELLHDYREDINARYRREIQYFLEIISGKKENTNDLNRAQEVLNLAFQ